MPAGRWQSITIATLLVGDSSYAVDNTSHYAFAVQAYSLTATPVVRAPDPAASAVVG